MTPRIRAGIGPKPPVSLGQRESRPSPGTPRGEKKHKLKTVPSTARMRRLCENQHMNNEGCRVNSICGACGYVDLGDLDLDFLLFYTLLRKNASGPEIKLPAGF